MYSRLLTIEYQLSKILFSSCEYHTSFTLVRIAVITMSRNLSGAQFCHCKIPGTALSRDRSTCDTRPITNPACSEETCQQPLSFVKSLGHWARRMAMGWWGIACSASHLDKVTIPMPKGNLQVSRKSCLQNFGRPDFWIKWSQVTQIDQNGPRYKPGRLKVV